MYYNIALTQQCHCYRLHLDWCRCNRGQAPSPVSPDRHYILSQYSVLDLEWRLSRNTFVLLDSKTIPICWGLLKTKCDTRRILTEIHHIIFKNDWNYFYLIKENIIITQLQCNWCCLKSYHESLYSAKKLARTIQSSNNNNYFDKFWLSGIWVSQASNVFLPHLLISGHCL